MVSVEAMWGAAMTNSDPLQSRMYSLEGSQNAVASYLLDNHGGNSCPSTKDIKKTLDCMGNEVDEDRVSKGISELNRKNIDDVTAQGIGKLASVPTGGAVATSAAPGSAAAAAGSALATAEEKTGEKEEESRESDDDVGFDLFD
ncbi:large ribosomal subunit protein P2-like [Cynocephalus volans]|uniref:large ribosomal subunit protein P2-like n=1 Tax=Cynocephalus volans TaxID=110931 RepID=UPI002FC654FD